MVSSSYSPICSYRSRTSPSRASMSYCLQFRSNSRLLKSFSRSCYASISCMPWLSSAIYCCLSYSSLPTAPFSRNCNRYSAFLRSKLSREFSFYSSSFSFLTTSHSKIAFSHLSCAASLSCMASWYFFSSIWTRLRSACSSTLEICDWRGGLFVFTGVPFVDPPDLIGGKLFLLFSIFD